MRPTAVDRNGQVTAQHYFSDAYLSPGRLASYAYQFEQVVAADASSVLEIGPGNGLVSYLLGARGIRVFTIDLAEDVLPDVCASVSRLPFGADTFDCVLCCEVLEHLAYHEFLGALTEINRVARKRVVISLPDVSRSYRIELVLPRLGTKRLELSVPRLRSPEHVFDGEHYWEIGKKGYPMGRIMGDMQRAGFRIAREFRIWENVYHHVFVLSPGQSL